jgi:Protein of unknown function (DUF3015)
MNFKLNSAVVVVGCVLTVNAAFAQKKMAPKRKAAPAAAAPKSPSSTPAAPTETAPAADGSASGGNSDASPTASAGYRAPYGLAGCGLGSIVFKSASEHKDKWLQVIAVTLNGTGAQTFGITTGSSNCGAGGNSAGQARLEQQIFFTSNFNSLTKEAAQGQGSSLSAFAEVLVCEAGSFDGFAKMTQDNYSVIFNSDEPSQVLNNYLGALRSNPDLSGKCTRA